MSFIHFVNINLDQKLKGKAALIVFLQVLSVDIQVRKLGCNGAYKRGKGEVFHRDTREVEERLLPGMYRSSGGGDAARRANGAPVQRRQQRREPQDRRHGEERGHLPLDPPPGPAAALHFHRQQTPGAAV